MAEFKVSGAMFLEAGLGLLKCSGERMRGAVINRYFSDLDLAMLWFLPDYQIYIITCTVMSPKLSFQFIFC